MFVVGMGLQMVANGVVRPHWRFLGISSNVLFLEGEGKIGSRLSLCVCVCVCDCFRESGRENGHRYLILHVIICMLMCIYIYILT